MYTTPTLYYLLLYPRTSRPRTPLYALHGNDNILLTDQLPRPLQNCLFHINEPAPQLITRPRAKSANEASGHYLRAG